MTCSPRSLVPLVVLLVGVALGSSAPEAGPTAVVTVRNPIPLDRPSETIVLGASAVTEAMTVDDLRTVHVTDLVTGRELLVQVVDTNDDGRIDQVIFQADLAPGATRGFGLSVGARHVYTRDQFRAYGRFVRERRDDYAWENDRTAHRMYGKALETWAQEPLTSSAVDVWFKRTRRLVINDWYMVDDYHRDTGEGGDMYSAGRSRGCGGSGIWAGGALHASRNFIASRTLANGPIRVMFELTYPAWEAGGRTVSEVKTIVLDAGHHLNRFESRYSATPPGPLAQAVGIKKHPDAQVRQDLAQGILRTWEPVKADLSHFGCGVVVEPGSLAGFAAADGNVLATMAVPASGVVSYVSGAGWDRGGDVKGIEDWDAHLDRAAQRLRAPVVVTIARR